MTATTIRVQMAQRKDTAANWTAANPILLSGEIGYETDTKKFKIGNGSTNWNSLAYLPIPDGSGNLTITGNLEIGSTGSLTFEGSTADGFETTLAVTNPTADRTITLPDVTGTVVTTGDTGSVTSTMIANGTIVDADVSSTAEIAVSKLANGTANQVIVTDGTNVSWSDNLTLAGDLTVNGTTTTINTQDLLVEDKNIIIGNVTTPSDLTADGGGITLKGATDKTINWVDATDAWTLSEHVNIASAKEYRIDGTKVLDATSLGSAVVSSSLTSVGTITSGTWQGTAINATYLDSTVVKTTDTGTVTSAMLADGTIVDGDISATAEIAVSKLADGSARQLLQTDAAGTDVEWASNIDIPGTLDVTGAATLDSTLSVPLGSAGSPSIYPGTDTNTGIYSPGADQLAISTGGTGRIFIAADGKVGISNSAPETTLDIIDASAAQIRLRRSGHTDVRLGSDIGVGFVGTANSNPFQFRINGSEVARLDTSGRLLVGTSTVRAVEPNGGSTSGASLTTHFEGTDSLPATLGIIHNGTTATASSLYFARSRGASVATSTVVANGDILGTIAFAGADGTDIRTKGAEIYAVVDGTPGANDMPGRLVFSTTADGASSPTERLRITSAGVLQIADAGNIAVGTTTGTKIGTATTQKLGFFNKTPVVQPTAVADATDAASVITQLNALLARMRDLGLIAT